jgi:thioredoxin reductase
VIIGAGPSGLSAAIELRRLGISEVVVIERENVAGGVPRHCNHTGFGLRDLHRSMTGPRYSAELVWLAQTAGVRILVGTTVTKLDLGEGVFLTSGAGLQVIRAAATVLASGARERPRSARLVAGDRPSGIFTTGQLQQWSYLKHLPVGTRALVVGAEHVSFSAMLSLRHAGVATIALTTEFARHQSVAAFSLAARTLYHVPIWTSTRLVEIKGTNRVREVVLENVLTGERRSEHVDTIVFSGDWIPDSDLARRIGVEIDPGTLGPSTDSSGHTSVASLYAAGNVLHPVETADIAALGGRQVARNVASDLRLGVNRSPRDSIAVISEAPLSWAWPNMVGPSARVKKMLLRTSDFDPRRTIQASQDGRLLGTARCPRLVPNRSLSIRADFLSKVDPLGGPLLLSLRD